MSSPVRGARGDYSKGIRRSRRGSALSRPVRLGLLGVGLAGAILLVVADFSPLIRVKVITVVYGTVTGHREHTWAMALIGVLALPMVYGAAIGGSRPARAAATALGLIAVTIALFHDAPDLSRTGICGQRFEDCHAGAAIGFYLETLGAVLLLLSGGLGLLLGGSAERSAPAGAEAPSEA